MAQVATIVNLVPAPYGPTKSSGHHSAADTSTAEPPFFLEKLSRGLETLAHIDLIEDLPIADERLSAIQTWAAGQMKRLSSVVDRTSTVDQWLIHRNEDITGGSPPTMGEWNILHRYLTAHGGTAQDKQSISSSVSSLLTAYQQIEPDGLSPETLECLLSVSAAMMTTLPNSDAQDEEEDLSKDRCSMPRFSAEAKSIMT